MLTGGNSFSSNFSRAFITWWMHTDPLFYNIFWPILVSSYPMKAYGHAFQWLHLNISMHSYYNYRAYWLYNNYVDHCYSTFLNYIFSQASFLLKLQPTAGWSTTHMNLKNVIKEMFYNQQINVPFCSSMFYIKFCAFTNNH